MSLGQAIPTDNFNLIEIARNAAYGTCHWNQRPDMHDMYRLLSSLQFQSNCVHPLGMLVRHLTSKSLLFEITHSAGISVPVFS